MCKTIISRIQSHLVRKMIQVALVGFALTSENLVSNAGAQSSTTTFAAQYQVADGSVLSISKDTSPADVEQHLTLSLLSKDGITSVLRGTLIQGQMADYGLENLVRDRDIDLLVQCPSVSPSINVARVQWIWPDSSASDQVHITLSDGRLVRVAACDAAYCSSEVTKALSEETLGGLIRVANDTYMAGSCFEAADTTSSSVSEGEFTAPETLADDICAGLVEAGCHEPAIFNQNLAIMFDVAGGRANNPVQKLFARQRRALSRALKSSDDNEVKLIVRKVVRRLNGLKLLATHSAAQSSGGSRVVEILKEKRKNLIFRVIRAIGLLRLLERL